MEKICAVVVTYNRLPLLRECLTALQGQSSPCDILVMNNASTDGTAEWLKSQSSIFIVNLPYNTGGAGGFNAGMKEAIKRGYEYIWLMDDDTLPRPDALEQLLAADKLLTEDKKTRGNYGWLSSVALWTDGQECKMNRQKLLKAYYKNLELLKYGIIRAEQATFVSLLIKSSVVKNFGLPIKEFFIWCDDIEFTRRIAVRGNMPCYIVGQSVVTHAMKDNDENSIATASLDRLPRYKMALRNENYLFRQEGIKGFCYYLGRCIRSFLWCLRAKDHKMVRCCLIVCQFFKGMFFNPKIERIG